MRLVGRHVQTTALREALGELARGRGRGVLIEGEPGSGKTALLDALLTEAAAFTVRAAKSQPTDQSAPLAVLLRTLLSESALSEADAVARILTLVDELCARGPLLLVVDDLHAADESSLLVWQRLCVLTGRSPLLLVGTHRPLPRRREIDRVRSILKDGDGLTLSLDPLSPDEVAELVHALTGTAPDPQLTARLESAGGNPRLVRDLVANADIDSVAAAVAERLGFLDEEIRELLRTASLLGAEFAVTELSAVLRRPAGSLAGLVQEAVVGGVLEPVGPRLRFRHGLLRQALQESTPPPVRTAMRQIAIRALMDSGAAPERVAELIVADLALADGWETPWVARHAASLAQRAPDLAVEIFDHILARPEPTPGLREGLATLALTLYGLGRRTEAERTAARVASDPELAPVWRARLRARSAGTRQDAADALAEGESLGDPIAVGYALGSLAVLRFRAGDVPGCLDAAARGLHAIGPPPRLPECRRFLADAGSAAHAVIAYQEGRWDDACTAIDSVTDQGELHGLAALIALRRDEEQTAQTRLSALSDQDPYALRARAAYAERTQRAAEQDTDPARLIAEIERLRAVSRPADLARMLEELAVCRAGDGDEPGAREAAAEAQARYAELGATWDSRRLAARLRTHGVRIANRTPRRPSSGPRALTESELRIAEFLSQGKSNPDIAEELSLSRRTVETHVSRILAKLGVRTRREAAELLRRE